MYLKYMKKAFLLLTLILCLNANAQKGNLYLSNWLESRNDITIPLSKYICNNKGKLCYFFSNDNENFSCDILFNDINSIDRVLKEGMTVWIDMDGKQTKKMGVKFPLGAQLSGSTATLLSMANIIELIGFTRENERRFPSENADNCRGYVKIDEEGVLHYKMIIPITKLPVRNSKDASGAMPFNIGIEYGVVQGSGSSKAPVFVWIKNVRLATGK
jgi:hypothetical protein